MRNSTGIRSPCTIKGINKARYTKLVCGSHLWTDGSQATMTTTHNIEISFKYECNDVENVSERTDYGYYMVIVIGYLFQRLLYARFDYDFIF